MKIALHINNYKKAPKFDGINYSHWKALIGQIKSINREVWQATITKIEIKDEANPTAEKLQFNDIALSSIHEMRMSILQENQEYGYGIWCMEKIRRTIWGYSSHEGFQGIYKEKFASFEMHDDESVLKTFNRMHVLVNDLKALGEKSFLVSFCSSIDI